MPCPPYCQLTGYLATLTTPLRTFTTAVVPQLFPFRFIHCPQVSFAGGRFGSTDFLGGIRRFGGAGCETSGGVEAMNQLRDERERGGSNERVRECRCACACARVTEFVRVYSELYESPARV